MNSTVAVGRSKMTARKSITDLLSPLDRLVAKSTNLTSSPIGRFSHAGEDYEMARYVYLGNRGQEAPIRIGIFAGIHGDEPEGVRALAHLARVLESNPELSAGYCVSLYPACNPTGLEDHRRNSRTEKDLNREFWRNSTEPEVRLLEAELETQRFDGIISLHTDIESSGFYGFVRGATLTKDLLRPALAAAAKLLPINQDQLIDGFHAEDGLIKDCYEGILGAPPKARPKPFEIILEAPGQAPVFVREAALVMALHAILSEYRKFISYAANL